MKKFTNVNILNEKKKKRKNVFLSLISIVLALVCKVLFDMFAKGTKIEFFLFAVWVILLLVGVVFLIAAVIDLVCYPSGYRKLEESKIGELDKEMNDEDSNYYEEMKFYLTKNYMIDFIGDLHVINYEDILWVYRFEQRSNDEKINEGIRVVTNDGIFHNVANLPSNVKTVRTRGEMYNEIWKKVASKNTTMLLGYTNENIEVMNEKLKETLENGKVKDELK